MVSLVGAIPKVQEILNQPVIVGGLAVMSRLDNAYRTTQDLDTLRRRIDGSASGLEVLRDAGASDLNEIGVSLPTARGMVRVDVLEARDSDLDRTFTDPTDRLEAMAHHWTLDTATTMAIYARDVTGPATPQSKEGSVDETHAVVLVARPGPLVAMKLKASIDRLAAKEATDLNDIVRLMTDPGTAERVMTDFETADKQLRQDVALHAEQKFVNEMSNTRRLIRTLGNQGASPELIDGTADLLSGMFT
ncbi:nucleotidyl transferase AbiEii/AbiGii toxin family protein [Kribbella sp. NPDC006257]|uniref:nucleotidyl transferase AbiEii/AbiGii toxin family protein n=1 Tax=Kribbella sp. NPDC006257 TaxID=3156738 RepID=UPI0033A455BF